MWRRCRSLRPSTARTSPDRKSTRLNSSHLVISYAVFCLKKKTDHLQKISTRPPSATNNNHLYATPRLPYDNRKFANRRDCLSSCALPCFFFLKHPAPPESPSFPHHAPLPT